MEAGTNVKTTVDKCGIPAGSFGKIHGDNGVPEMGASGETYQVLLKSSGALYYREDELETV